MTPEEEEEDRWLDAVSHPAEVDPEAENYPPFHSRWMVGEGPDEEKFSSPFGTVWTRRAAREYFARASKRSRRFAAEMQLQKPPWQRIEEWEWDLDEQWAKETAGMDPETEEKYWQERAAKCPPWEEALLRDGPDNELFNNGFGSLVTRKHVRRDKMREEMEEIERELLSEIRASDEEQGKSD